MNWYTKISQIDLNKIANDLDLMQKDKNQGRGVDHIRSMVSSLKRNDLDYAKAVCNNESDKMKIYPDIYQ